MGGMLEGSVIMCIVSVASWRRCNHENLCGHPGCYITRTFSIQEGRKRVPRRFLPQPLCLQLSHLWLSLTHTYILGNKRKRKNVDYIFIHQRCYLSRLYNNRILKCIWLWGSSTGTLKNMKYPFIAITSRSTLTLDGIIYWGLSVVKQISLEIICINWTVYKKSFLWNETKMWIWMYNERNPSVSKYEITLDWLTCYLNQSIL